MADIFLSYASEDRERIEPLVTILEAVGWTLWWDRDLIAGPSYAARSRRISIRPAASWWLGRATPSAPIGAGMKPARASRGIVSRRYSLTMSDHPWDRGDP